MSFEASPRSSALPPVSLQIWDQKYRLKSADGVPLDATIEDTWRRVARAAAGQERDADRAHWEERFYEAMSSREFLPAGRIIAGAGSGRDVTLFNCFVMGPIGDDLGSIFDNLKEAALTMQRGGGIGHDFSTLRPEGALVASVGAGASGPVSFMDVWDAMCRTIMSAGQRRGAMMGTLRCDHPDIETFIDSKAAAARLRNFNLSVLVTDEFLEAVRNGQPWALRFDGRVVRTLDARALWDRIMRATYEYAEPGVIFIDRINAANNLAYCEQIHATNPCGEQPLPPYGACLLGSLNLASLVRQPFEPGANLDEARLTSLVPVAVRFLDDVIDVSGYPLAAQRQEAKAKRRIGLGITGLADALAMCGVRYGSAEAVGLASRWMSAIEREAYRASAALAAEKGAFPLCDVDRLFESPNIVRLDDDTRAAIRAAGLRNGCLTSIAPTGTISLLAGNVSSGIEPIFDLTYRRRIRGAGTEVREEAVEDYAYRQFRAGAGANATLPAAFITVQDLKPEDHLAMQAAVQAHVDSSISKTINCRADISFEEFKDVYARAYALGLKGCTTFRPNSVTGSILEPSRPVANPAPEGTGGGIVQSGVQPKEFDTAARRSPDGATAAGDGDRSGVVYMARPLEREPVLAGYTYKLKWVGSDHAIYVTINDIERDGRRRPFEIFINTKNLEHYAWTVALTRMISAVFRRGGDVSFVVDELKAVFDPQGGQWMGGQYVPSLLAAIGNIIEQHLLQIGFLQTPMGRTNMDGNVPDVVTASSHPEATTMASRPPRARHCPRCDVGSLVRESGCWICRDCGYAKCG